MQREPVALRASSLGDLFDCPARWEARQLLGMRLPMGAAAALGKAVHASTAVFDQGRIDGAGITADEAAAAAVDVIHRPDEDVAWDADLQPAAAESIALGLHRRYCDEFAPRQNYAAVEVRCDELVVADLGLRLTGSVDRVHVDAEGDAGITDLKTGKAAVAADGTVSTRGHAFQLGVYELLAEAAAGVPIRAPARIVGMTTAKTAKAQRIAAADVAGARDVLLGDEESPGVLRIAADLIHSGRFYGNPRSMSCHASYCPRYSTCSFRR